MDVTLHCPSSGQSTWTDSFEKSLENTPKYELKKKDNMDAPMGCH